MIEPHNLTNFKLSKEHINEWRSTGCVVVNHLFPRNIINNAYSKLDDIFKENMLDMKKGNWDFGSNGKMEFPCNEFIFNDITIHPNMINAVKMLLNDNDIRLTQSDVWPKYGQEKSLSQIDNHNQRIHMDYGNNMLVHPMDWNNPEAVSVIIYYSTGKDVGGSTAVVPREGDNDDTYYSPYIHMSGIANIKWHNDKEYMRDYLKQNHSQTFELQERLYAREKKINYIPGTVLFYRLDTWHRGTPINPKQLRYVHNIVFKKNSAHWILNWNYGISRSMYRFNRVVENIIANCTVEQRSCLGFPPPGDAYWTDYTLKMTEERYKGTGFDITPYKNA